LAEGLKKELDNIYVELTASENLISSPNIVIGTVHENPVVLNRNDAGGERGIWKQEEIFGKWKVEIKEGIYDVKFKFIKPIDASGRMYLETGSIVNQMRNEFKSDIIEMKNIKLPELKCDLIPFYMVNGKRIFPFWVEVNRLK
jgi:hypothetical protein